MRQGSKALVLVMLLGLVMSASPVLAQTGIYGGVQGRVTDASGGALPGVTVTLTGAALMGTQTTVSEPNGDYRFPALTAAPDYRLQFELTGFTTLIRTNVGVTVRETSTLNVSMELASLSETVTVTGATAVVDTTSARQGIALTSELLQEIPSARDSFGVVTMAPGGIRGSPSVGGSTADLSQMGGTSVNGGGSRFNVNGAETTAGAGNGRYTNFEAYEEVVVETGGAGADTRRPGGGFAAELIARQGGNQLHGLTTAYWYNHSLVGDNLNPRLIANGLTESGDVKSLRDMVAQVGGPFWRDHVWFFGSAREYKVVRTVLGNTHTQTGRLQAWLANVSFQTNSHNKFQLFYGKDPKKDTERGLDRFVLYYASGNQQAWSLTRQVKYLSTLGKNTVLEAQAFKYTYWWPTYPQVGSGAPYEDTATGYFYNGELEQNIQRLPRRWQTSGAVSRYVSDWLGGSHDLKVGGDWFKSRNRELIQFGNGPDADVRYQVANGVPSFATIDNGPIEPIRFVTSYSAYGQDKISAGRITMNVGARFDYYRGWLEAQQAFGDKRWAAFFPPESFPANKNTLTWRNVSPRVSAIYKLTGDGKTLLKASWGYYPTELQPENTDNVNPNQLLTNRYRWLGDLNNNGVLDPDTELGTLISTVRQKANSFAPGFRNPNVKEQGISLDRELPLGLGLRSSYYYVLTTDTTLSTNVAVPASAYTPVPYLDPGPDGKAGTADDHTITVYNQDIAYRGIPSVTVQSNFPGIQKRVHAVTVTVQRRLNKGWQVLSSYSFNRFLETTAHDLNNPNNRINDTGHSTAEAAHVIQFAGSYLLPKGGVQLSSTWSLQTGQPYLRTLSVSGLNQGTFTITADPAGTWRYDTRSQFDIRVEKQFRMTGGRLFGLQVEGYNMLNNSATTILGSAGVGSVTGGNFGLISHVVPPRTFRFGSRFTF